MGTIDARSGLQRAISDEFSVSMFSAYAQTSTATLTGIVSDQSGALIPGATIKVTDSVRDTSLSTITNEEGSYLIPVAESGNLLYWSRHCPGSKAFGTTESCCRLPKWRASTLPLRWGRSISLWRSHAAPPLLESETSSRGSVIDEEKIVGLPLNGRDYYQTRTTVPGVLSGHAPIGSVNFKGA